MIPTSTAVRRRIALLAQQRPALDDNRQQQQQQEGSTDLQWVQDAGRVSPAALPAVRAGLARLPSHRMPARAPVIGAMDDCQCENLPALALRGAAPRAHETPAALEAVVQQA